MDIDESFASTSNGNGLSGKNKFSRKRRCSSSESEPLGKVFVSSAESDSFSNLLNLSDEVLLEILKNCDSITLDTLSQ